MAELERSALISDEALAAPLEMANSFDKLIATLGEVRVAATASRDALSGGNGTKNQKQAVDELAKAQEKLNRANSDTAKELAKLNIQTQQQVQANKQAAKTSLGLSGAYDKLNKELNEARRAFKDLAASGKASTKELEKQAAVVNTLDQKIKKIDAAVGQFNRNVGNYPKTIGGFTKALGGVVSIGKQLIGVFGIVEGIRLAANFAKEAAELADQAKGVQFAFDRLGDAGVDAFNRVKVATRGTLSDLAIETSLVDFDNFNISLEESATLFEFLSVRAAQTGKNMDYLKDSLVEGLSKESKLRIDNLGISAATLNKELEKTPNFVQAVANIARTEIAEAGNILDEAASGQLKFNAELENFKLFVGSGFVLDFKNQLLGVVASMLHFVRTSDELANYIKYLFTPLRIVVRLIQILRDAFNETVTISPKLRSFFEGLANVFKSILQFLADIPNHYTGFIYASVETFKILQNVAKDALIFVKDLITATFDPTKTISSVIGKAVATVENYGARIAKAYNDGFNKYKSTAAPAKETKDIVPIVPVKEDKKIKDTTQAEINARLAKLQREQDAATDLFAKGLEEKKKLLQQEETFTKNFNDRLKSDAELRAEQEKAILEEQTKHYEEQMAKRQAITEFATEAISLIGNAIFDNNIARIEAESAAIEDKRNKELERAGEDAELKSQIDKKYDRQQAQLKRRQAVAEKASQLFNIGIATAYNIVKVFPNPLLMKLAALLGVIQGGVVASRKIPEFDKGVQSSPSTFIAGEKRPEFVSRNGRTALINKPTLFTNSPGSMVVSGRQTEEILGTINDARLPYEPRLYNSDGESIVQLEQHLIENNNLLKRIVAKPVPSWSADRFGFREFIREGFNRIEKMNRRFGSW